MSDSGDFTLSDLDVEVASLLNSDEKFDEVETKYLVNMESGSYAGRLHLIVVLHDQIVLAVKTERVMAKNHRFDLLFKLPLRGLNVTLQAGLMNVEHVALHRRLVVGEDVRRPADLSLVYQAIVERKAIIAEEAPVESDDRTAMGVRRWPDRKLRLPKIPESADDKFNNDLLQKVFGDYREVAGVPFEHKGIIAMVRSDDEQAELRNYEILFSLEVVFLHCLATDKTDCHLLAELKLDKLDDGALKINWPGREYLFQADPLTIAKWSRTWCRRAAIAIMSLFATSNEDLAQPLVIGSYSILRPQRPRDEEQMRRIEEPRDLSLFSVGNRVEHKIPMKRKIDRPAEEECRHLDRGIPPLEEQEEQEELMKQRENDDTSSDDDDECASTRPK